MSSVQKRFYCLPKGFVIYGFTYIDITKEHVLFASNQVSTVTDLWKLFGLFVVITSIQEGLKGFSKQVLSLIRFLQRETTQKSLTAYFAGFELRSWRRITLSYFEE